MKRNTYDFTVKGHTIKNFEFIAGPMAGISIPHPPRPPHEFLMGAFNGGATPIAAITHLEPDIYINSIKQVKALMGDRYFGANMFAPWASTVEFIKKFNQLGDESPSFLDLNAIELNYENIMPLLKDVDKELPLYLGINQPISVYTFKKYLLNKEYAFLIERIESGKLKLYFPNSQGGGHLPILAKEDAEKNWVDEMLKELHSLEEEIHMTIPFIVEKGMMTVDDFVNTIVRYGVYPSFSGVRFASCLEVTTESGLNATSKALITKAVKEQNKKMIIPVRSNIGAKKFKKGRRVRGGVITYMLATEIAKIVHEIQCEDEDFPKYNRTYNPTAIIDQAESTEEPRPCRLCIKDCPKEFCEVKGAFDSVVEDGNINLALILISPKIFQIDPAYLNASVTFVVQDIIQKTLKTIKENYA